LSRYTANKSTESQHEPGSRGRVLKNLLAITRVRDIDQAEYESLLTVQEKYFSTLTAQTRFTAKLICDMHCDWLGRIYPWAGNYRTVEMSKGNFTWPPAFRVAANMQTFENDSLKTCTPCPPGPIAEVALKLARVHADFLFVHPFRDGNGRIARLLADLMASQAGIPRPAYPFPNNSKLSKEKARYIAAVSQGYALNYAPLTDFFIAALARRLPA
jgi:cell filamentation protein